MESNGDDAISVDVGARLRALREERGLSLRGLARESGLSANALSMIERGRTSPSVSTLYKVAAALGIPITSLFRLEHEKQRIVFTKAAARTRVAFPRGLWEGLGGEVFEGRLEPFAMTLENGARSGPHPIVHSGNEFVLCLRGQLEYQVEKEVFLLEPGDSLIFASRLHHRWKNPGPKVTNAIVVLSGFASDERPSGHHISGIDSAEPAED